MSATITQSTSRSGVAMDLMSAGSSPASASSTLTTSTASGSVVSSPDSPDCTSLHANVSAGTSYVPGRNGSNRYARSTTTRSARTERVASPAGVTVQSSSAASRSGSVTSTDSPASVVIVRRPRWAVVMDESLKASSTRSVSASAERVIAGASAESASGARLSHAASVMGRHSRMDASNRFTADPPDA